MKTQARWIARIAIVPSAVLVAVTVGLPVVHGQAAHVRWDIINLTPGPTVNPGGQASPMDNIGDTITFTGTGTFVAPSGGGGTSSAVTGGGNWAITHSVG
jgi:energy-converting hydrogenase Eha subunit A